MERLKPPTVQTAEYELLHTQRMQKWKAPLPAATLAHPRPHLERMCAALMEDSFRSSSDAASLQLVRADEQGDLIIREETHAFFKKATALFWQQLQQMQASFGGSFLLVPNSLFDDKVATIQFIAATPEQVQIAFQMKSFSLEERLVLVRVGLFETFRFVLQQEELLAQFRELPRAQELTNLLGIVQGGIAERISNGLGSALSVCLSSCAALNTLVFESEGQIPRERFGSLLRDHEDFLHQLTQANMPAFQCIEGFLTYSPPDTKAFQKLAALFGEAGDSLLTECMQGILPNMSHLQLRDVPAAGIRLVLDLSYDPAKLPDLLGLAVKKSIRLTCPANAQVNREFIPWLLEMYSTLVRDLFVMKMQS